jgi:hypothetical protein
MTQHTLHRPGSPVLVIDNPESLLDIEALLQK